MNEVADVLDNALQGLFTIGVVFIGFCVVTAIFGFFKKKI